MRIKLYHGSKSGLVGAIEPTSRFACDFGKGFYLGDSAIQPLTLICRSSSTPKFYTCSLDLEGLNVHTFDSRYEWALYIAYCRGACEPFRGTALYDRISRLAEGVDVMVGKIANDRMFMVLTDFFDGVITDKAMLSSLEVLNLGTQYCLKTPRACARVTVESERLVTSAECETLQIKSENQRQRAIELTQSIYKKYRRDGLFFDEFFEKYATEDLPLC